jgi:hypothetical protein
MLRVKRLRDSVRVPAAGAERIRESAVGTGGRDDTRLRNILLLLIAIVAVLAIAGIVLMMQS